MANFQSKDLTISIPEPGVPQPTPTIHTPTLCGCTHITNPCLGFTHCTFSPHTCYNYTCGVSPIISPGTCTTTYPYPTFHPTTTIVTTTETTIGTTINNISDVTDADTLTALKEKLTAALKEVETQHAAITKK